MFVYKRGCVGVCGVVDVICVCVRRLLRVLDRFEFEVKPLCFLIM